MVGFVNKSLEEFRTFDFLKELPREFMKKSVVDLLQELSYEFMENKSLEEFLRKPMELSREVLEEYSGRSS